MPQTLTAEVLAFISPISAVINSITEGMKFDTKAIVAGKLIAATFW